MSKRLTKSEYLLTYMIIITFVCFIGGFFLGAGVMKARIQAEAEEMAKREQEQKEKEKLFQQQKMYRDQDFIRFYYGVQAHMRELKDKHFAVAQELDGKHRSEQISMIKDLLKMAETKQDELDKASLPETSPLLLDAKRAYQNSLGAYVLALEQIIDQMGTNSLSSDSFGSMRQHLGFVNEWNHAQTLYYQAMALWESVYVTKKRFTQLQPQQVASTQWKAYPFHYRNYLAAQSMSQTKQFHPFYPEDLTSRIDSVVQTVSPDSLGWKDIAHATRILQTTDAVRLGDFMALKDKLYPELKSPEIPLFSK